MILHNRFIYVIIGLLGIENSDDLRCHSSLENLHKICIGPHQKY